MRVPADEYGECRLMLAGRSTRAKAGREDGICDVASPVSDDRCIGALTAYKLLKLAERIWLCDIRG